MTQYRRLVATMLVCSVVIGKRRVHQHENDPFDLPRPAGHDVSRAGPQVRRHRVPRSEVQLVRHPVVMDQYTRRIAGFGVHRGVVDGVTLCQMFNRAIGRQPAPTSLSSDHDPQFAIDGLSGLLLPAFSDRSHYGPAQ